MLEFTTNQWAILVLVLVLGWLLGLLSRSNGAKWRHAYEDENQLRLAAEAHARSAEERAQASAARIAELERQSVADRPVTAGEAAAIGAAASGERDDLALIRGIGRSGETRLNEIGIYRYRQITDLNARDEAELEGRLGAPAGTIDQEQWREQASLLAARKVDEHRKRFG